jgi:hypothetical protein
MSKLLIAAFIVFGIAAVVIIPNKSPEEVAVEAATIRTCQDSSVTGLGRITAAQKEILCRCAAPLVVKHAGSQLSSVINKLDQLPPESIEIMKRELLTCYAKHAGQSA